jgi:sensor histidine kinase YesM
MISLKPNFRKYELDKSWQEHLLECFYLSLLGLAMGYYFCSSCYQDWYKFLVLYVLSGGIWISQWKGHSLIHAYLDNIYPWFDRMGVRALLTIVQVFVYTVASITLVHAFVEFVMGANTGYFTIDGFIRMNLISIIIGTFITLTSLSSQFLRSWRQSEINAEKLKAAHLTSQFETLKNQVNPHFLFNSLNVLTNLVYEDQDTAAKFIKQLSHVYRYVLESKDKNLVPLNDEMDFIKSFVFLQQMRFGDNLKVNFDLPVDINDYQIPPLALQMLIENAIKHNIVSKQDPLNVEVKVTDSDMIVVENNLQKKNISAEESSGIGLKNVIERYQYISKRSVEILEDNHTFLVKLPLIKTQE